ncbi:hypothetical protein SAMN05444166_2824 [Singulisphaera sp. GP187]|nr:hypothetical protein SAMN05444166_2824 [Singulisphaera sp. GP187]
MKYQPVPLQVGHDGRDLEIDPRRCLGVWIPQPFGDADLFFNVFRVGGDVLCVTLVSIDSIASACGMDSPLMT